MIHRFFCNLARGEAPLMFWVLITFIGMALFAFFFDKIIGWIA